MPKTNESTQLQLDKQVCFSLYSASNALSRAYQPVLKGLDLTYLQYIVMMVLWQYSTMNVKELGSKVYLDSGTLTPLLKRLQAKGLVVRSRSEQDERVCIITLTEAGLRLREAAEQVPDNMLCKSKMAVEDLAQLKQACDRLRKNLSETD